MATAMKNGVDQGVRVVDPAVMAVPAGEQSARDE
jgi:hypothetical protein